MVLVCAIVILFFSHLSSTVRENITQEKQEEMVKITLEWGRLAPLPDHIENFSIHTEGSAFTRSFRASFGSTDEALQKWIEESPGLLDATVEAMDDDKQKFVIMPGGGANYAEVIIDFASNTVQIYVSWS